LAGGQVWAAEAALVMAVQGRVLRQASPAPQAVETFVKLNEGDRLSLAQGSKLQLVYFESGRQETWSGPGSLELASREGKASGMAAPEVQQQPLSLTKQLARTPALDGQGRGGVTRLRALQNPDAVARLEGSYQELRSQAAADDLGPEVYLLAGLLDLRQLDRIEKTLDRLQQERSQSDQVAALVALYRKAVKQIREGGN
ncbi:MAG: hypothetical protein NDI67_10630, partial [Sulfuritalea sp.]|nr:hypothetical protein [Sulfuritalea sp.]